MNGRVLKSREKKKIYTAHNLFINEYIIMPYIASSWMQLQLFLIQLLMDMKFSAQAINAVN